MPRIISSEDRGPRSFVELEPDAGDVQSRDLAGLLLTFRLRRALASSGLDAMRTR